MTVAMANTDKASCLGRRKCWVLLSHLPSCSCGKAGTRNRFSNGFSTGIPADDDAPLHDVELVNEFGEPLLHVHSRRPDDVLYIDDECQCACVKA
mmetsp:Transcript_9423/g.21956  ORF Transcript_9423/g.21956 Transcript_9423/m.21956 type:complete len:95 (-) Transcript_9423:667-951(-)